MISLICELKKKLYPWKYIRKVVAKREWLVKGANCQLHALFKKKQL